MSDDDISPKGCLVLAAFIDEVGQRSFGDAWTGQEANARLLPAPQTDADVLAIIDKLRGNQHHLPLPDDAPPVRDPPRSIANSDWGKPEAPRRAASSLQWAEALAEIDRVNAEPRSALARLADVERHCAEQLIWGDAVAVSGHALEPIAATWWGDDWKAKLRHGKKDGKAIFVSLAGKTVLAAETTKVTAPGSPQPTAETWTPGIGISIQAWCQSPAAEAEAAQRIISAGVKSSGAEIARQLAHMWNAVATEKTSPDTIARYRRS